MYSGWMPAGLVRLQQTGHSHFITFTCYRRMEHLTNSQACSVVLRALENTRSRYGLRVFGFVLMPEHVHLLLSEPEHGTLARALQSLKSASARMARGPRAKRMGTLPPFWQTRYYDRYMRDYDEFSEKLRYIHRNPVKRGLCSSPEQWHWSSFWHYWDGTDVGVEIESEWTARASHFQV
jgi:putative transposase